MTLILGAGLAGLTAAHDLGGRDALVLEREDEVGGLCRSIRERGFTFDYTGHLLHLRDASLRGWVLGLLDDGWRHLRRSAWIHSHGVLTPYPFQANTADLPIEVRLECLLGFVDAMRTPLDRAVPVPDPVPVDPRLPHLAVVPPPRDDEPSFLDWIHRTFGAGFARHFFEPYNGKLWRRDLSAITGDWVSWSIPRPELRDVIRGAITTSDKAFGYNPDFLYPAAGGIDALPRAIAARLPGGVLRTGVAVERVHAGRRRAVLSDGSEEDWDVLLASAPLPSLIGAIEDAPAALREDAARLSWVSIRAVNVGVRGEPVRPDAQWIYVPDPSLAPHRVGLPCALTPAMAPEGHHSLVAEIAFDPDDDPGPDAHLEAALDGLARCGLLPDRDAVVHTRVVDIPKAYVVFDRARREVLPRLFAWCLDHDVVPMGRYGAWDYLSMEDSLRHGRATAAWVRERAGVR